MDKIHTIMASFLVFLVAVLYSAVGHGGASGYIAALTLFTLPQKEIASTALILNLVVSGTASFFFFKAGYFNKRLLWPLLISSVPAAFIGGLLKVSGSTYDVILFITLSFAAYRLLVSTEKEDPIMKIPQKIFIQLVIGGVIGLISGMIGVGGGIFLSPLIIFLGWANPKQTASVSASFIFFNSISGILGRISGHNFVFTHFDILLIIVAIIGSQIGSRLGAFQFSNLFLKRLLGIVLLLANLKILSTFFK